MKYYTNKARQTGMTLIELTVVLLVLIGLAGLMIPYVSGFVSKTHDSTGSFNSAALDANIQRYQAEKLGFPSNMESLVDTGGAMYTKMMTTGFYVVANAGMQRTMSLAMAGITDVVEMDNATDNATFRATGSNASETIAGTTPLAAVTNITAGAGPGGTFPETLSVEQHLAAAFERDVNTFDSACYDYVAFGIGDKSDLIGSTMSTAPVHFAQQGAMGPANRYNRFVAVFQVDKVGATGTTSTPGGVASVPAVDCSANVEAAKFIGSAMSMAAMSGHLWGTSHSLAHTWQNIAAN